MIIQCVKCQTKFRLDDSRITDKGVKVRCTKCKHVFTVQKEVPEVISSEAEVAQNELSSPIDRNDASTVASEDQTFIVESVPSAVDTTFAPDTPENVPFSAAPDGFATFETSHFDTSLISFDTDTIDDTDVAKETAITVKTVASGGDVDFSGFDFGDSEVEPDTALPSTLSIDDFMDTTPGTAQAAVPKNAPQGLDFSDDDMFGEVVPTSQEVSSNTISFDFEDDSFAESMDMSGQDSNSKNSSLFSLDSPGVAPFNLGEIDFGDELTSVAVQQVNPEDLKPAQEILFAPLASAQNIAADYDTAGSFPDTNSGGDRTELPPLSIASRRKQNPLFGLVISVVALLVVLTLGYFGYSSFSTSKETAAPDAGKISVQSVKASFIKNTTSGEMLVISGEAHNEYAKPRATLQVKVSVFDSAGQNVATKIAYGGNPLTREQLETLSFDKIEAAMANQFGDSLANMEVAPGKTIPFVVVLANLPKGAKDYAVQSAGSTVATGKQQ